ncbi:MAG: hypothetical protein NTW10_02220 [Bacteroidetes bacterium]|nr:hypothetical protein [Bacteroidota bacterium]
MNWKLIFLLSLFGLAMAFATVSLIPIKFEPAFWLVIFIICAYLIAKYCADQYFLHGFLVGIANCLWILVVHSFFFQAYLASHPHMEAKMAAMEHPLRRMILFGPVIGIVSGIILGLFALLAVKLMKKKEA